MNYNNEQIELALLEMMVVEAATASTGNKALALITKIRTKIKESNTEALYNPPSMRFFDKVLTKIQKAKIDDDINFYPMIDLKYFTDSIKLLEQAVNAFNSEKLDENALAKVKLNLERIYRQDAKKRHSVPVSQLRLDKFTKEREAFIDSTKDGKLVKLFDTIEKDINKLSSSEERFPGEVTYLNKLASAASLVSSRLVSYINLYKQDLTNVRKYLDRKAKSVENDAE